MAIPSQSISRRPIPTSLSPGPGITASAVRLSFITSAPPVASSPLLAIPRTESPNWIDFPNVKVKIARPSWGLLSSAISVYPAQDTTVKDFHELQVWQKAHQLALAVYHITGSFPREELYGLTSQLRARVRPSPRIWRRDAGAMGMPSSPVFVQLPRVRQA